MLRKNSLNITSELTIIVLPSILLHGISNYVGQERYRSLAPMYYRGAAAAIVVYDITKKVRSQNGIYIIQSFMPCHNS